MYICEFIPYRNTAKIRSLGPIFSVWQLIFISYLYPWHLHHLPLKLHILHKYDYKCHAYAHINYCVTVTFIISVSSIFMIYFSVTTLSNFEQTFIEMHILYKHSLIKFANELRSHGPIYWSWMMNCERQQTHSNG